MFGSRHRARHRHAFGGVHAVNELVAGVTGRHRWAGPVFGTARRRFSLGRILIAGLAVLALTRVVSRANRGNLTTAQKIGLGVIAAAAGIALATIWRAGRRRW